MALDAADSPLGGHPDCEPADGFNMIRFQTADVILSNLGGQLDPEANRSLYISKVGHTPAPNSERIDLLITNTSKYEAWRDEQNGVRHECERPSPCAHASPLMLPQH